MKQTKSDEIRKHLHSQSRGDLIDSIMDLDNKFKVVDDYLRARFLNSDDQTLLLKYKKIVHDVFFENDTSELFELSKAEKAVETFSKLSISNHQIADLMLYYVEMGVNFTNEYGDIDEDFYINIETMFKNASKLIKRYNMQEQFYNRCEKIFLDTDGIGWGFYDGIGDIFYEFFKQR
jgi:hypothetical protein